jgi:hypothetical protein
MSLVVCTVCLKRIRKTESHIAMEDATTRLRWNYHQACLAEAEGLDTGVYVMDFIHVCGDEDAGFDCIG